MSDWRNSFSVLGFGTDSDNPSRFGVADLRVVHGIAGLTVETRSDIEVKQLGDLRFEVFRANADVGAVDVQFSFAAATCGAAIGWTDAYTLAGSAPLGLTRGSVSTSAVLSCPRAIAAIAACSGHEDECCGELHPCSMSVLDFRRKALSVFYAEDSASILGEGRVGSAALAALLLPTGRLMLHSSAVVVDGLAAVFLAPDGGGKTTVARLAGRRPVICDDQVILEGAKGAFEAWSSPWGRFVAPGFHVPLGGLFILEKASHFSVAPAAPGDLLEVVTKDWRSGAALLPPKLQSQFLDRLWHLSRAVPCCRMQFSAGDVGWEEIGDVLRASRSSEPIRA